MSGAGRGNVVVWLRRARARLARLERSADASARLALALGLGAEAGSFADETIGHDAEAGLAWARAAESVLCLGSVPAAHPERLRARRRIAEQLHAASRHEEALSILDELKAARRRSDVQGRAEIEGARAAVLGRLGRGTEASAAAALARRSWLILGRLDAAAQVDVNHGNSLHRRERHAEALALYRRAVAVLEKGKPGAGLAAAWLGVGNTLSFLGRGAEARRAYLASEELFARSGRERHRLVAAYNRHYLDLLEARPQRALDGLAEVRAGFEALGDAAAAANCELDVAEVYLHLRTFTEAEAAARRAASTAEELGLGAERARALVHLARSLLGRGGADRAGEAEAHLLEAEGLFHAEGNAAGGAHAQVLRAELLLARGRAAEALTASRAAAAVLRRAGIRPREAAALVVEARALLQVAPGAGGRRSAVRRLERAAALGRPGKWASLEARTLLGRVAFDEGRVSAARREVGAAARLLEELGAELSVDRARSALLGDLHGLFRDGVRYWLSGPRPSLARAFDFAEQSRRFASSEGKRLEPAQRRAALEAFATVGGLRGGQALPAIDLAPAGPASGSLPPVSSLRETRSRLHAGELLVLFQLWPREEWGRGAVPGCAIVVDAWSAEPIALPETGSVGEEVARLHAAAERCAFLSASGAPAVAIASAQAVRLRHARELGRVLLGPLEPRLSAAGRVLIVAGGALLGLPFGLLPHPATGRPLGLSSELIHLPSASWLARTPGRTGRSVLAVGPADEAAPLIEAELESVVSAARAAGHRATLLSGSEASIGRFEAALPGHSIVHFAGHGFFRWDGPEQSSLRFADGWVSAAELEGLRLRVDLTVLSACRGGALRAGGGQFAGLARALLRAGSRAVLASPWTLADESAARIFAAFHRALSAGASAAAALQRAAQEEEDPVEALSFSLFGAPNRGAGPRLTQARTRPYPRGVHPPLPRTSR